MLDELVQPSHRIGRQPTLRHPRWRTHRWDRVHELDASEHIADGTKRLTVQHRPRHALNRPMVLFDDVVEIHNHPE